MPFLTRDQAFERFRRLGRNSSHFVWFLDRLSYFESSHGWVFGYLQIGAVTLVSLEPLTPVIPTGSATRYSDDNRKQFEQAWEEFRSEVKPRITAFVAVYSSFLSCLKPIGFQSVKVGQEPWIDLGNCIPRGNAGKGVRSARNQALRSGLKVEEWQGAAVGKDPEKRQIISKLLSRWGETRILHLKGFLNATDPFAFSETRRYFVVRSSSEEVVGYLIATPVPGVQAWFLEDMVLGPRAPRGAGELLTLETMVTLRDSGVSLASLGVVSMTAADSSHRGASPDLPSAIRFLVVTLPKLATRFYNFNGLEMFRKRFEPSHWESVHLAVKNEPRSGRSDTAAWIMALIALARAFRPRIRPSFAWFWRKLSDPFRRFPVTLFVGGVSLALFARINHFGELPEAALSRYGFVGNAPLIEWIPRSIISDFLYFEPVHFLVCVIPLLFLIRWVELTHRRKFVLALIPLICVFDDLINYAFIIRPFHYIKPHLFEKLIAVKDVGGSLWLATLFGLQLCQLKKYRELIYTAFCLASVFAFIFSSEHYMALVLNINHFLFLTIGFIIGKLKFEQERRKSRAVAKNKPPEGNCVLPSEKKLKRLKAGV